MVDFAQLAKYQQAAMQMCYNLGEDPYSQIQGYGTGGQLWMVYANRMYEHYIMVTAMRSFGQGV